MHILHMFQANKANVILKIIRLCLKQNIFLIQVMQESKTKRPTLTYLKIVLSCPFNYVFSAKL